MPRTFLFVLCVLLTSFWMPLLTAQDVDNMRQKAVQFLEITQGSDGSWSSSTAVGISGLVTTSLLQSAKLRMIRLLPKVLNSSSAVSSPVEESTLRKADIRTTIPASRSWL